jgi:glycosyltransferase involved in cell wall biosynthesis
VVTADKKRVFKIARFIYDWPRPWDGLAPAPYHLTKHQKELGNQITVFCGRWGRSGGPEKIPGVKVFSFPREPLEGLMLITTAPIASAFFIFWRIFHQIDIIHIHGHFGLYLYLYKFLFGWLDKVSIIAHFHNTTAGRLEVARKDRAISSDSFFIRYISLPLSLLSDKLAIKVAKACVFVSKQNIDEAVTYYSAERSKCFLVESGVPTEIFKSANSDIKKGNSVEILYVGALTERKNIGSLVESLAYLSKDCHLTLIGRGHDSFLGRLKETAIDKGVVDRITFAGYVENFHLLDYYKKSDIFVIPSLYEGLPKVVLEALASGVPVLASGFNIKSPIKGLSFLDDPTPRKIANEIIRILRSDKKVDVEYIEKFYSWKAKAKEVQDIYEKIS